MGGCLLLFRVPTGLLRIYRNKNAKTRGSETTHTLSDPRAYARCSCRVPRDCGRAIFFYERNGRQEASRSGPSPILHISRYWPGPNWDRTMEDSGFGPMRVRLADLTPVEPFTWFGSEKGTYSDHARSRLAPFSLPSKWNFSKGEPLAGGQGACSDRRRP